jgi:hypothetical protein
MQVDTSTLQAALIGYQSQLARIDLKIAEIRKRLGKAAVNNGGGGDVVMPIRATRQLSAAARKRIAMAQKARWAAYRAKHKPV